MIEIRIIIFLLFEKTCSPTLSLYLHHMLLICFSFSLLPTFFSLFYRFLFYFYLSAQQYKPQRQQGLIRVNFVSRVIYTSSYRVYTHFYCSVLMPLPQIALSVKAALEQIKRKTSTVFLKYLTRFFLKDVIFSMNHLT